MTLIPIRNTVCFCRATEAANMVRAQWSSKANFMAAIDLLLLLTAVPFFWVVSDAEQGPASLSTHNNSMESRGGASQAQCIEPRGFACACPTDKQKAIQFEDWRHSHILGTLQTDNPQDRQSIARENAYHNCRENAITQNCPDALEACSPGGPEKCGACTWCSNPDEPEVLAQLTKEPGVSCEPPRLNRAGQLGAGEHSTSQSQSPDATRAKAKECLKRGVALDEKGDAEGAIKEFQTAIRLDPNNAEPHYDLAVELAHKGDLSGAIAEYRTAIRLNPNDAAAHNNLGTALTDKDDLNGGVAEYRTAIRLNPNDAAAHNNLGIALKAKDDLNGAIAEFRTAIHLDPNYATAHMNLGGALSDKGDVIEAITEYHTAVRLNPNNAEPHYNLAVLLRDKRDLDGAITEYRTAIRLSPNHPGAHKNLGSSLFEKGDVGGAITEFRALVRISPNDAGAHGNLGVALEKKGDERGALEQYRIACSLDPKNSQYCQAARGKQ
jgi:Flp pilus assembly protein TadD